ncbi:MAG: hypothetical protein WCR67_00140 [Bacilli bacterium]
MPGNKETSITSISFWKRRPSSVDKIDYITMTVTGRKSVLLSINGNQSDMDIKVFDDLVKSLTVDCKDAFTTEFAGYKYEDTIKDYVLKFFLTIDFDDATYMALKGIMPFKQPFYQEIVKIFSPYLIEK